MEVGLCTKPTNEGNVHINKWYKHQLIRDHNNILVVVAAAALLFFWHPVRIMVHGHSLLK